MSKHGEGSFRLQWSKFAAACPLYKEGRAQFVHSTYTAAFPSLHMRNRKPKKVEVQHIFAPPPVFRQYQPAVDTYRLRRLWPKRRPRKPPMSATRSSKR